MVQVRDRHPLHDDGDICIDQWTTDLLSKVAEGGFSRETLAAACELARGSEAIVQAWKWQKFSQSSIFMIRIA